MQIIPSGQLSFILHVLGQYTHIVSMWKSRVNLMKAISINLTYLNIMGYMAYWTINHPEKNNLST